MSEMSFVQKAVQWIGRWYSVIIAVLLLGLLLLVGEHYFYLRNQTAQLLVLQEEYRGYLFTLRKLVDEARTTETEQPDTAGEKKKPFIVINRKPEYLHASLVNYLESKKMHAELMAVKKQRGQQQEQKKKPMRRQVRRLRPQRQRAIAAVPQELVEQIAQDISFSWPLKVGDFYISSHFGPRKKGNGSPGFHHGIDMAALRGTRIKAAAGGVVTEARYDKGFGNTILITHSPKYKTRYAHLSKIVVPQGATVDAGEHIGMVGSTGSVRSAYGGDPSHLHFEVVVLGKRINPLWVLPRG